MKQLSIEVINQHSPYIVWTEGVGKYYFETEAGILYQIGFDLEQSIWEDGAYEFGIRNVSGIPSMRDVNLKRTILCIVEEFFRQNPEILLYLCETGDGHQSARSRLFLHWFNDYEQKNRYYIKTVRIKAERIDHYASIIVQRSNPSLEKIIGDFERMVSDLTYSKPRTDWELY